MALNLPQMPFKLSPQDMGNFDLGKAINSGFKNYQEGINSKYRPQLMEAQINELKGRAQKNMMMSRLFESLMGGGGNFGMGKGEETGEETGMGGGNNMKAAVLKAFTGIDPFLMSPQQTQELKIAGQTKAAAQKKNLDTGAYNVARESLQPQTSLPQEYVGNDGTFQVLKDLFSAKMGDKAARERLVQAGTANKFVPEYAGAQLGSMGQKTTVPALKHQQEVIQQGWPKFASFLMQHLPGDIQKESEARHNKGVKEINKQREAFYASGGKRNTSDREMNININEQAHKLGVSPSHVIEDAEYFKTTPEIIISALQAGVKTEKEMLDWIQGGVK